VTSSEGRAPGLNFTYIAFPITLVSGKVSVTYLSSYENAGVLEAWVSITRRCISLLYFLLHYETVLTYCVTDYIRVGSTH
jgi:hypothetical protein